MSQRTEVPRFRLNSLVRFPHRHLKKVPATRGASGAALADIRERFKVTRFLCVCLMLTATAVANASAQPVVSGVSGTWGEGTTMTVTGGGFGSKIPARPLLWADFEDGINPSRLGQTLTWDSASRVVGSQDCPGQVRGFGCLAASDASGKWTTSIAYSAFNAPGQHSYVYRLVRKNFAITNRSQNWKTFRIWPAEWGVPNLYLGENNGIAFVENTGGLNSGFYFDYGMPPANTWIADEIIIKASRTLNVKDGSLEIRRDGKRLGQGAITTLFSAVSNAMNRMFPVHFVLANMGSWNPAWSQNNRAWADDVYVDTTWARVMIGNAATYAACTHLVPQIPTTWSDRSITVNGHLGALRRITTPYVYVLDAEGRVNAVGLALGGLGSPQNLRIQR